MDINKVWCFYLTGVCEANLILRKVSLQLARAFIFWLAVLFEPVWYLRKISLRINPFIVISNITRIECVIYYTYSLWYWKTLFRARSKWEGNIKISLKEIRWKGMDWIHQAQNRGQWQAYVSTVINLWVPYNAGNFLTSWTAVSFSRRIMFHRVKGFVDVCFIMSYTLITS